MDKKLIILVIGIIILTFCMHMHIKSQINPSSVVAKLEKAGTIIECSFLTIKVIALLWLNSF